MNATFLTKLLFLGLFLYLSFTQYYLFTHISNLKTESNSHINKLSTEFETSISKLTKLSHTTAKVLRNFEKRHSDISEKLDNECKRREKKMEENHIKNINDLKEKMKKGDVELGPDVNNFFPTDINSNVPLKMNFVIKFEDTNLLKETFHSFSKKLKSINVKYHFYALSKKDITNLDFQDENLSLIIYQKENLKYSNDTLNELKILNKVKKKENLKIIEENQYFIGMLKKINTLFQPYESYLFLDEGWKICDHSIHNFVGIYYWSLKIRHHWLTIKIGSEFSGMFLKAGDSNIFIQRLKDQAMNIDKPEIYSTHLPRWWSPYSHIVGRHSFTFRYNLLIKKDKPIKCFQGSNHHYYYLYDRFDTDKCQKYLMSPCHEPHVQNAIKFIGRESIESKSIIRSKERAFLMDKLNVRLIASETHSTCNQICEKQLLKCSEESIQFANSCEFMKSRFQCNECLIGNERFGPFVPNFSSALCFLSDQSQFKCNVQKKIDGIRICPCKQVSSTKELKE
eukprot:gene5152-8758_t